jgi:phage-related protein
MIQLDLLDVTEIDSLVRAMKELKESQDNTRRGLFARYNDLERTVLEIQAKLTDALFQKAPNTDLAIPRSLSLKQSQVANRPPLQLQGWSE